MKKNDIAKKKCKILVEHGLKMEMHRVLGYSRPTINSALRGASMTEGCVKIRMYALHHGGVAAMES